MCWVTATILKQCLVPIQLGPMQHKSDSTRGRLKVFLGYASGVGKSFRMFDEARRRKERGQDVVVGALQPQVPPEIEPILSSLEIVPTIDVEGVPVIDVPAILRRHPQVCVVDGLAYDNPWSRNAHRWQDVEELLANGINVVGSVNLQHIDDQREAVEKLTGRPVIETIPREFLNTADEIVVVDAPTEGAPPELSALREMALVLSADVIDAGLQRYLQSHDIEPASRTHERFLVCLTAHANTDRMIASARQSAARFHCDVLAIYVRPPNSSEEEHTEMEENLAQRSRGRRPGGRVGGRRSRRIHRAICTFPRRHADFCRAQHEERLESAPLGNCREPSDSGCRRYGRSCLSTLGEKQIAMTHLTVGGHLKIYLGYAPGVGKTYQMLEDARELKARGVDLVIGFVESHGRNDIRERLEGLQTVPLKRIVHRGGTAEELDVDAVLRRSPRVCVVDELAHSNAPGSARQKRWQDVQVLLQAGIDVLTTMNVQDLASLSDQIWQLTGLRVRETVPDWLFQQADEVVIVDVTPRALLHRLERGVIYPPDRAKSESERLFQEPILVGLRELAIRQTAQALEARQTGKTKPPESQTEKILVNVTADPSTAMLLRRARRVADHLQAVCIAVYVHSKEESAAVHAEDRPTVDRHLRFAENLHIPTEVIHGNNRAQTLVDYARKKGVTQLFLNRDARTQTALVSRPGLSPTRSCSRPARWKSQWLPNAAAMAWLRLLIRKMKRVR